MELQSKVKILVIQKGYNSLADFADKEKVSYFLLRKLAFGKGKTIDVNFLLTMCKKLDCQISDLLVLKK